MTLFAVVPVAASGPATFRCSRCYCRVTQSDVEMSDRVSLSGYASGTVWADLDGAPFIDYYCTRCKRLTEERNDG